MCARAIYFLTIVKRIAPPVLCVAEVQTLLTTTRPTSTMFIIVKQLKFTMLYALCVCVCVCV